MKKNWPRAKVIILTGYGTVEAADKAYLVDDVYMQCKPFDAGILRALVDVALHQKGLPSSKPERTHPHDPKG